MIRFGKLRGPARLCAAITLAGTISVVVLPMPAMAATTVTFDAACNIDNANKIVATQKAAFPASVATGTQFSSTKYTGSLMFNALFSSDWYAAGFRSIGGTITTDYFDSTDASPSPVNAAGASGLAIPKVAIPQDSSMTLDFPPKADGAEIGPFTAGSHGTDTVTVGDTTSDYWVEGTLDFYYRTGVTPMPFECVTPSPAITIGAVTVTS